MSVRQPDVIATDALRLRLADPGFVVVDVRPLFAYNGWRRPDAARGGHVPGAVAFPGSWFESVEDEEIDRLLQDKEIVPTKDVDVYGDLREDSYVVARWLAGLGHSGVCTFS